MPLTPLRGSVPDAPAPVHVTGLGVSLGGIPVLRHVNVRVEAGELVALMGGNGSGKTTFVRTVLGLVEHQAGTVSLFGTSLDDFDGWARIGYVPQRGNLAQVKATVAEVVASSQLAHRKLFTRLTAADRARVDAALEQVGLTDRRNSEMAHLSGGQQQRVLIARALASEPELMVLDEPLAGVDLVTQASLAELIGGLNASGMTVLIVLHELGAFQPLLRRGIVLHDGRVVSDGPLPPAPGHGFGGHEYEAPTPATLLRGTLGE